MRKLKLSVFDNMKKAGLTSAEINFLVYISGYQDDSGMARGIHYKEVCMALNLSYESYYDILNNLQEKGIITWHKNNYYDRDIYIIGNDFSGDNYRDGYLNMSLPIFREERFYRLKAGAKFLAMSVLQFTETNRRTYQIGTDKFYRRYVAELGVSRRVIRGYLKDIKTLFSVGLKDGKYFITPLAEGVRKYGRQKSDNDVYMEHIIKAECRRQRIKSYTEKEVQDVAQLSNQYKRQIADYNESHIRSISVVDVIRRTIELMNQKRKKVSEWIRVLRPKLVHQELRRLLNLQIHKDILEEFEAAALTGLIT